MVQTFITYKPEYRNFADSSELNRIDISFLIFKHILLAFLTPSLKFDYGRFPKGSFFPAVVVKNMPVYSGRSIFIGFGSQTTRLVFGVLFSTSSSPGFPLWQ